MTTWGELFPPNPTWTEKDIPSQNGRVFIVTGGATGLGFEVAKTLYHANGRVYIAGRSASNASEAITTIKALKPHPDLTVHDDKGELFFLKLDLSDLSTIKNSADEFLQKEQRLDVIWHNAGVMGPPEGSITKQGFELTLGTNVLGPFLFQHFLTPLLIKTAKLAGTPKGATRVVWVSSNGHRSSPRPDGVEWDDLNLKKVTGLKATFLKYGQSKAMNVMFAHEMARRSGEQGLVSYSCHPGSNKTQLNRHQPILFQKVAGKILLYEPRFGGLTELFAGLAATDTDGTELLGQGNGRNGAYIYPWGRFDRGGRGAEHVFEGLEERGTGQRLWEVCETLVREYM